MVVAIVVGFLVLILLIVWPIATEIVGYHYQTGAGDHTGYITSVEKNGVFFKTGTAYLKTSTQATQEDAYCVIDPSVYDQLQADSVSGVHVNVHYHSWFAAGIANCDGEGAIIDSVTTLSN